MGYILSIIACCLRNCLDVHCHFGLGYLKCLIESLYRKLFEFGRWSTKKTHHVKCKYCIFTNHIRQKKGEYLGICNIIWLFKSGCLKSPNFMELKPWNKLNCPSFRSSPSCFPSSSIFFLLFCTNRTPHVKPFHFPEPEPSSLWSSLVKPGPDSKLTLEEVTTCWNHLAP